ncbi:Hydroxycinnamoyltransferase 2 [Hypsizygus marmoreus]|uniref:Hydroxycinnamoyltransferase 2 n=1 Tax=Hypsizygus marmoreus TaxID=39966 RepID=A0A369JN78_HYPMA|nr:Hydroxycinnamoyltransferase 2 [Hypsizygus marmoreus]
MPVTSRVRLLPSPSPKPVYTPLSILDAVVARFSPTAAIWMYEAAPSIDQLTASLKRTLDAYPQWAGQLQWAPYDPRGDHTQRYGRFVLVHGTDADPGVEYIISTSPRLFSSLVGETTKGCLEVGNFPPSDELLDPTTPLALHNLVDFAGLPCMIVQVTTFADHGVAIAVKFTHPVADAHTMLQFTLDWASVNKAMLGGTAMPVLAPVFDPQLVDRAAAGDIDAAQPDPALLKTASELPLHRYDCWASSPGCPAAMAPITVIPSELKPQDIGTLGSPLPWNEWDSSAPVSHCLVRFDPHELHAMWEEASSASHVSHLDALLAHIWSLIIRARGFEGEYHLDVTFGFRNRLDPPLPSTFLGSPLTLTKVTTTLRTGVDAQLKEMAESIRACLNQFTPVTLPALLHEMIFEVSPQRRWNAFFGNRNTIVTTWLQLGIRDVDFGTGTPAYVEAVMPSVDGCIQVMEGESSDKSRTGKWYDGVVVVSLHLKDEVMERLLHDPSLRKYRN